MIQEKAAWDQKQEQLLFIKQSHTREVLFIWDFFCFFKVSLYALGFNHRFTII